MILIADDMHPLLLEGLKAKQIPFNYQPQITLPEVLNIIGTYEGLVVRSKFMVDKPFIDSATRLKFIARAGSGTDNIDADYAAGKNIAIINAPEGLCDAVAEHAMGLILGLQHKIVRSNQEVMNQTWNREANRGIELMGSTVGIIGYGHTGSALGRKLSGFGVNVIAYDKYKIPEQNEAGQFFFDPYATSVSLNAIYEQTDILSMHVPLTPETSGWVNKKFFEQFKKPIVFINTSRGGIVNTFELTLAMEQGNVRGAALDVLEQEPPFSKNGDTTAWYQRLRTMDQVILTPHIAGWSTQSYERISEVLLKKINLFYNPQN